MKIEISEVANLPSRFGAFKIQSFKEGIKEHLVIFNEPLDEAPLVRIHSECLTGTLSEVLNATVVTNLKPPLKLSAKSEAWSFTFVKRVEISVC